MMLSLLSALLLIQSVSAKGCSKCSPDEILTDISCRHCHSSYGHDVTSAAYQAPPATVSLFIAPPSFTPSMSPTASPTHTISHSPSTSPTTTPTTQTPTASPSESPTSNPTQSPTNSITSSPTRSPTGEPTKEATKTPTATPVRNPTESPVSDPTQSPVSEPISSPVSESTQSPASESTQSPISEPTSSPVSQPTAPPTLDCSEDVDADEDGTEDGEDDGTYGQTDPAVSQGIGLRYAVNTNDVVTDEDTWESIVKALDGAMAQQLAGDRSLVADPDDTNESDNVKPGCRRRKKRRVLKVLRTRRLQDDIVVGVSSEPADKLTDASCGPEAEAGKCAQVNGGVVVYYDEDSTAGEQETTTTELVQYFKKKMDDGDYIDAHPDIQSVVFLSSDAEPPSPADNSDIASLETQETVQSGITWMIAAASVAAVLIGACAILVIRKRQSQKEDDDDDFAELDRADAEKGKAGLGNDMSFDLQAASTADLTMASTFLSDIESPYSTPNSSPIDGQNATPMLGRYEDEEGGQDEDLLFTNSGLSEAELAKERDSTGHSDTSSDVNESVEFLGVEGSVTGR